MGNWGGKRRSRVRKRALAADRRFRQSISRLASKRYPAEAGRRRIQRPKKEKEPLRCGFRSGSSGGGHCIRGSAAGLPTSQPSAKPFYPTVPPLGSIDAHPPRFTVRICHSIRFAAATATKQTKASRVPNRRTFWFGRGLSTTGGRENCRKLFSGNGLRNFHLFTNQRSRRARARVPGVPKITIGFELLSSRSRTDSFRGDAAL